MTKDELRADIAAKAWEGVVLIDASDVTPEQAPAGYTVYRSIVLQEDGNGRVNEKKILFRVTDEGGPNEKAAYSDDLRPKGDARAAVIAYLESLTPGTFAKYDPASVSVNEEAEFAQARVLEVLSATEATFKDIVIARVGGNFVHRVLV